METIPNSQIEAFLRQMENQLAQLPPTLRTETLAETRAHLEAMLAAHLSGGLDTESAARKALADFGSADEIGGALVAEWQRAPRVETEGTPLSKREKTTRIVGTAVGMAAVYAAMLAVIPWLQARHIAGYTLLGCTLIGFGCGWWYWRRKGGFYTPASIASQVFAAINAIISCFWLQFQPQIHHTIWENLLNEWFGGFIFVGCVACMMWHKREAKTTRPWRMMPRYATNPIAAEEEYRNSPILGLVAGTTMGCVGMLWVGWQFFGMGTALLCCFGLIAVAGVVSRIVR